MEVMQAKNARLQCDDSNAESSYQNREADAMSTFDADLPPRIRQAVQSASPCGIAERDGSLLTPSEFYRDFVSIGRPVLIRNAALGTSGKKALRRLRKRWTNAGLSKAFGKRQFDIVSTQAIRSAPPQRHFQQGSNRLLLVIIGARAEAEVVRWCGLAVDDGGGVCRCKPLRWLQR